MIQYITYKMEGRFWTVCKRTEWPTGIFSSHDITIKMFENESQAISYGLHMAKALGYPFRTRQGG